MSKDNKGWFVTQEEINEIMKEKYNTQDEEKDEQQLTDTKESVNVRPVTFESIEEEEINNGEKLTLEKLLNLPIPIRVRLGSTIKTIAEIAEIREGSIIELSKMAGEPAEIIVGDQIIARGEIEAIEDDIFGVQLTEIVPPKERVEPVIRKIIKEAENIK